jgi:plasmid stabilization system protein ParE
MKAGWSEVARQDRRDINDYLTERDPRAALTLDEHISEVVRMLEHYPFLGRRGRLFGTREFPVSDSRYLIIYRVDGERPFILRVIHTSRDWPPKD